MNMRSASIIAESISVEKKRFLPSATLHYLVQTRLKLRSSSLFGKYTTVSYNIYKKSQTHYCWLLLNNLKLTKQECLSALCRASFVDVYLAYLRSYGHLKIVKCIGMY